MKEQNNALNLFHPLIAQWFPKDVGTPTDIQERAWPEIAKGNHVLVTAPTGSGKTMTAFLWAINRFLLNENTDSPPRVLYISPLKALNNDIRRNLETPLENLQRWFEQHDTPFPTIRTAVRSGDTEPAERRKMMRYPPEIFITTPESLNVLLCSKSGRKVLTGITTVILDEIHAVADSKRGTYLITAVERLVQLCGEFQRIALSATVKPLKTIADFVGGYRVKEIRGDISFEKRKVSILTSDISKQYNIKVRFPENAGNVKKTEAWWQALTDSFIDEIKKNNSTLFFANSRRMVEKITRFINEKGEVESDKVYSHHGSLSKEIRSVVEQRFKDGELSGIIATSSLELGIDIGAVDQVVLIQAPYSIASAIQRIGRSGHGVGQASSGVFYPIHSRDLIEAAVLAANIDGKEIESITPIEAPLDVLAQVLLASTLLEPMDIEELYGLVRSSYPFRNLSRKEFDLVVEMLAGRYADARIRELKPRLLVDRVDNTVKARDNTSMLLFMSGGVIPDRGYYNLRVADSKAKIGELDEEFVWERSLGDAFPLGNQIWRIQRITHNDVEVVQVPKSNSLIPFWRAEDVNRSFHLSEKIGCFLEDADQRINTPQFKQGLLEKHHMSEKAATELISYLKLQKKETKAPLPHRRHLLVEHFRDPINTADSKQTVIHTMWGGPVNRPLAFALSAAWAEKYKYSLDIFVNNDCIMLNLPHEFSAEELFQLARPSTLRKLLRTKLESTGYFGAAFRQNAQRALLLPRQGFQKRMPLWLNRLRSKKLLEAVSHYEDFPILIETWRGCMNVDFDIDTLLMLLEEISTGVIQVTEAYTQKPSPFADSIMWRQTNKYMYDDDSPDSKAKSNLSDSLIKEILHSSHLRPRFPEELLEMFQGKLHRTAAGYAPSTAEELLQWVRERLYIPLFEWRDLCHAILEQSGMEAAGFGEMLESVSPRLYFIPCAGSEESPDSDMPMWKQSIWPSCSAVKAVIALENLPRIHHVLQKDILCEDALATAKKSNLTEIYETEADAAFVGFLRQWLQFYGPVSQQYVVDSLGIPRGRVEEALEILVEDGRILIDQFREPVASDAVVPREICDTENLEILLRMRRRSAEPTVDPLEIEMLPLFLAAYQGLTMPGVRPEDFHERLESLFGYPAKAGLWESDILPARVAPYYTSWLDSAMRAHELIWFGCGSERLGFCFAPDYELFASPSSNGKESTKQIPKKGAMQTKALGSPDPATQGGSPLSRKGAPAPRGGVWPPEATALAELFSGTPGKLEFGQILDAVSLKSAQVTQGLWHLAWEGQISNDDFQAVRMGLMNRFKAQEAPPAATMRTKGKGRRGKGRFSFNRWQTSRPFAGNWFPIDNAGVIDALENQELLKDRIRQLFMRYGLLFRELLWNELPALKWSKIFPVLRLMEFSGEVFSGHFFKGVPGLQFCTPAGLRLITGELPADAVYWMSAVDPASVCGIPLEELRFKFPHRVAGTHIVFHGNEPVLVSRKNGKELEFHVKAGHSAIDRYLEVFKVLVGRDSQPMKYVTVETINDQPAGESPYAADLREFGFKKDYRSLVLMKQY
ncbi:MAG: DEAD/DEAH box helicase [bacterium]|nr:DEAD/DEAH box helicase [bacterium]